MGNLGRIKMDAVMFEVPWPHIDYAGDYLLDITDEPPLDLSFPLHPILYMPQDQEENDHTYPSIHNPSTCHEIADGLTVRVCKKMSQHRLLLFLRFLDNFVNDFVSQADKIADYHNNLIFRRIRKELFLSLREHFNYRMAPNPYQSDIVFTAFFLFNVLVQSVQKPNWNPITLPDQLTEIFSQRDAMKRLVMLCVKQYQEAGRVPKGKRSGVPPNRYYRCIQPFFKSDAFIVSVVHTIQDHISMAIQTVTRYIEQRKAQLNEQKSIADRRAGERVSRKGGRTSGRAPDATKATEADVSPSSSKNMSSTDVRSTNVDEFTPSGTQELLETPTKLDECPCMFSASQDQADQWITDYLQHTNSGFYTGEDFDLDDPCFLPIN